MALSFMLIKFPAFDFKLTSNSQTFCIHINYSSWYIYLCILNSIQYKFLIFTAEELSFFYIFDFLNRISVKS